MAKLTIQNLHKSFGQQIILSDISLTADTGNVIGILGSSGAGKSTLLRCVNLLEMPDQGSIQLSNEIINIDSAHIPNKKQITRLRTRIGMVFQQFNLWAHLTIIENIILAPMHVLKLDKKAAIDRAEALLTKVGIMEKRDHYPRQLSGGQQQRVAIARALAMQPDLLLFDEPVSALDPEMRQEVLQVMKTLAHEGTTMLITTHEINFARELATHILFLHQGKVLEYGPKDQIFNNPKTVRLQQFLASEKSATIGEKTS